MFEHILTLAAGIVQPSDAEKPLLAALCAAAQIELAGRLRSGVSPEDCGDAFPCAAALLAAAGILPCRSGGEVEQFSAGDVSVRTGGNGQLCQAAAVMRRQAVSMLAPYAEDGDFVFRGVRG